MPTTTINGISVNYEVSGHGEPLLLITGFASDLNTWAFQLRAFNKHFQVIRFDNRGIGESDKPEGPYSTREMAEDAIGLLDHLGIERAHVVGHSMGGAIAQEVAISHPERVSKLVLCASFARRDDLKGSNENSKGSDSKAIGLLRDITGLAFNRPIFRWPVLILSKLIPLNVSIAGLEGQMAASHSHDTMSRLNLIQAPTLVIVGTRDRLIRPTSSEIIGERIPNAKLVKRLDRQAGDP